VESPNVLAVGARLANRVRGKSPEAGQPESSPAGSSGLSGSNPDRTACQMADVGAGESGIELLRALRFDLVAVGDDLPDMSALEFAGQMKAAWPSQKWALVGKVTEEQERAARKLGAVAVLEGPDAWKELAGLASAMRRRRPETRMPGLNFGPETA
jgi:DNA-binding response OmpR family regulator